MSTEPSHKRHAVPGEEPDIFESPLEVPCVRRTGLWAIGTSSVAFVLQFYRSRSVGRAFNVMVPIGVISGTVAWVSCRREWVYKHNAMRMVQEMRELEPRLLRFHSLDKEEDAEERRALLREVATKFDQLRKLGIDLHKSEALDPKAKRMLRQLEEKIRNEDAEVQATVVAAANAAAAPDGGVRGEV
jgi:hypothetical protein